MTTLTLIADRSTMSGGDLLLGLAVIAVILGALYGVAALGERRAARDNKRHEPKQMPILWDGGEK
jgi:hypothetical protein